ncbi:hypothetical protein [Oceanobacillus sp. Castelsardo]|uniref:hypothetical protein n=1 Tax=Oceanobacillus sp. Castelsardo TaxID=1851204 RepID=UPI000837B0F5|nr:hypothetical protein [Oceanobacillus sp. Castelsardo]
MNKRKTGSILGVTSTLTVIISIIFFYIERGPGADVYFIITIFVILSILGVLFAIFSWLLSKRLIFLIIGILGNGFVLAFAYLLQAFTGP